MKIFNWKKDNTTPASDPYLVERLNADMNYCGLSPELQKGFLFYLGTAINIGINESPVDLSQYMLTPDLQKESFLKIINAYSQSTGNFSDYGDLNDGVFSDMIYTCNSRALALDPDPPVLALVFRALCRNFFGSFAARIPGILGTLGIAAVTTQLIYLCG